MNIRLLHLVIAGLCLSVIVGAAEQEAAQTADTNTAASASQPVTAVATQQTSQTTAPAGAEPTEAEMRQAVQQHINNILSGQIRPAPASTPNARPYDPYWAYYYRYPYYHGYRPYSKESDYPNWTDAARSAGGVAKVEIVSFKKIRCTAEPEQGGFVGEYIAELRRTGNNPVADGIMQTSSKPVKAMFYRGDKGWIVSVKE
jgi:hypothetical protein